MVAKSFLAGCCASCGAVAITNPADVIRTRLELQGELARGGSVMYRGALHGRHAVPVGMDAPALELGRVCVGHAATTPSRLPPGIPLGHPGCTVQWARPAVLVALLTLTALPPAGLVRMVQQEGAGVLFRGLKPAFAFQIAVNGTRLGAGLLCVAMARLPGHAARRWCSARRLLERLRCISARCRTLNLVCTTPSRPGTFIPLKRWLVSHRDTHGLDDFFTSLLAGAGAGMVGAAIGTPFQLIKTRMQAAARGAVAAAAGAASTAGAAAVAAARPPYSGLGDALATIVKNEGARGGGTLS